MYGISQKVTTINYKNKQKTTLNTWKY